ncbi:hypothetical protein LTR17_008203 [Elasticomyces elasticus]|nr:hypothetical protein LTR17_008203 [Elasticomyces elasticus]
MFRYSRTVPSFPRLTNLRLAIEPGDVDATYPALRRLIISPSRPWRIYHIPTIYAEDLDSSLAIDQVDCGLHGITFMEIANERGFTLLPNLEELHLAGLMLTPKHILDFVGSRKSTLRNIYLQQIRDLWLSHDGVDEQLRQILGDIADVDVKIEDSWNGRWLPSWAAEAGLV